MLNVKYVLEGSVQRAGDQVRVDVQLIQVSDETHLWAVLSLANFSDVLQVESDVSAAISRQVLAALPLPPATFARHPWEHRARRHARDRPIPARVSPG